MLLSHDICMKPSCLFHDCSDMWQLLSWPNVVHTNSFYISGHELFIHIDNSMIAAMDLLVTSLHRPLFIDYYFHFIILYDIIILHRTRPFPDWCIFSQPKTDSFGLFLCLVVSISWVAPGVHLTYTFINYTHLLYTQIIMLL